MLEKDQTADRGGKGLMSKGRRKCREACEGWQVPPLDFIWEVESAKAVPCLTSVESGLLLA